MNEPLTRYNTPLNGKPRKVSAILNQEAREHPHWYERQVHPSRSIYRKYTPTREDWVVRLGQWNIIVRGRL